MSEQSVTLCVIEYPTGVYSAEYGIFKDSWGWITGYYEGREGNLNSVCPYCGGRLNEWCDSRYSASDVMRKFIRDGTVPEGHIAHKASVTLTWVSGLVRSRGYISQKSTRRLLAERENNDKSNT